MQITSAYSTILLSMFLTLLCTRTDTLYDPTGRETTRCFAFLSDSLIKNPTLADTVHLIDIDTIHTGDSIAFIGIITPSNANLASAIWNFGDSTTTSKAVALHRYAKGGVYTVIFTIKDKVGITLSDSVTVHVNTPPQVTSLIAPADRAKDVDPKDTRGIHFKWTASDPDDHDSLRISLYISADSLFLQPSATNIYATSYDYIGNLKILARYFWRITATDNYGWTDTSIIYSFTTKDPNASGGILQGYAMYQGWNNHRGIKIKAIAPEAMERTAKTDDSGYYRITNIEPRPNYTIIAIDSIKNEYISDSTRDSIGLGVITIADTLILKDPFKPIITNPLPQSIVANRRPQISASFSDKGSGILVPSAHIKLNDSDITGKSIISGSGILWSPSVRMPDQTFRIAIMVKDSAGNKADTMKWTFTVDAMRLSILTPDTTVRINDTVRIRSKVNDVFSKVEQYKWDFDGNGTWDDSVKSPDTIISRPHVYKHEAEYKAIVFAKDDSGMVKRDTVAINVGNQPPLISSIRADTTISIKDSILLSGIATDNDGKIAEYAWDYNGDGMFEYTSATKITAGYRFNTAGTFNAVLRVTDDDGKISKDTAVVTVVQDAPIPNAGQDTIVSIYDTIRLHGSASQQFGIITEWAWDIGNTGTFKVISRGDTIIKAPATENLNYLCVLRLTDDDGNTAKDSVKIEVKRDMPVVNAGNDTVVPFGDTVHLHGQVTQEFGCIVKYEWKFGLNNWNTSSSPDTTIVINFPVEHALVCSLSVTDDDGNRVVDEIKLFFTVVIGIAAGYSHSIILNKDSTAWTCGYNHYGQLGEGTTSDRSIPVQVMAYVQSMAGGENHSFFLKYDGTVWACGFNNDYELGDGTTTDQLIPVQVMTDVQSLAAGEYHSLFLKTDGTVWACGYNSFGQLGDGTTTNRPIPVQVMTDVQSIAAGASHSFFLKTDGTLWACGYNQYGQLGDGTTTNQFTPVQVMTNVQSMAAGISHSLIIKADGTLWTCGYNQYGQLGDGTTTDRSAPVQVMTNVKSIAAGGYHSLILKTDATLWTCGYNPHGQLGDGTTTDRSTPVKVMTHVKSIAAGAYHSLILRAMGDLWACGYNEYGQLGEGTTITHLSPIYLIIPPKQ